jgi:Glycosyltransferase
MEQRNFVFLSIASLPDQSASGLRISSFIDALVLHGHKCYAVGQAAMPPFSHQTVRSGYELFSLYNSSLRNDKKEKIAAFAFPKKRFRRILNNIFANDPNIYGLFVYQKLPGFVIPYLIRLCKKRHIHLFFDIVEYQVISQQDFLGFFINYLPNYATINYYAKKGRVTAISSYLYQFFSQKGIPTVYIPFFFDTSKITFVSNNFIKYPHQGLYLLYAGVPQGGRDTIVNAVKGILLLPLELQRNISFWLAGANEEQMLQLGLSKEELSQSKIFCHYLGRVRHEKVMELYEMVDYSLLLKPKNKRFSKAGFPTKISESLAAGVPPICNDTGDVGHFIIDGKNGLLLNDDSPEAFSSGILKALSMPQDAYLRLRQEARKTADSELSLPVFADRLEEFCTEGKTSHGN